MITLAELDREEQRIEAEMLAVLKQIKRDCRPEFAERVETYLREHNLLPRNDDARS
jgi:hypothetical protein